MLLVMMSKAFAFWCYFSQPPGEFTAHCGDPHFTVPCYCPGRIALALVLALAGVGSLARLGSTPLMPSKPVAEA